MSNHYHNGHSTGEQRESARFGAVANGALGLFEIGVAIRSGNIGFATESLHNVMDSVSFYNKYRAMIKGGLDAIKLRKRAATWFAVGGVATMGAGAVGIATGHEENASPLAIGVAAITAGTNSMIARKAHLAGHSHDDNEDTKLNAAYFETKLHAYNDMGTGWLYTAGLVAENRLKLPGIANATILVNGAISTGFAGFSYMNAAHDENEHQ